MLLMIGQNELISYANNFIEIPVSSQTFIEDLKKILHYI